MIFIHEILKTFLKWRSYIGIIAIGVIVPLIEIGFKIEGGSISRMAMRGFSRDFLLFGNMFNAYFVTEFLMNSLWVHIPFLITLVAGDMLAGEATGGTFRLLLTRPVSRTRILFLKYLVALSYTAILVIFMAVLSLGLGLWLFGTGDLIVPGKITVILPASVVPMRLLLAFTLSIWSMWCVASLAFLFSSLVENAIGPIIASMAVGDHRVHSGEHDSPVLVRVGEAVSVHDVFQFLAAGDGRAHSVGFDRTISGDHRRLLLRDDRGGVAGVCS
jgi:ABC-2 type transport system permease protein